jgi:hypothetical protein
MLNFACHTCPPPHPPQVQQLQERVAALTDEELLQDPAARLGTLPTSPRDAGSPSAHLHLLSPGAAAGAPAAVAPPGGHRALPDTAVLMMHPMTVTPGAPPHLPLPVPPHPHPHHHQLPGYPGAAATSAGVAGNVGAAEYSGPLYAALLMAGTSVAPSSLGEVPPGALLPPGRTTPTFGHHPVSSKSLPLHSLKSAGQAPNSLVGAAMLPAPQLVIPTPGVVAWLPEGATSEGGPPPGGVAGPSFPRGPSAPQQHPGQPLMYMQPSPYAHPAAQQYAPPLAPPFPVGGTAPGQGPPLTPQLYAAPPPHPAQAMMARAHSNEATDQAADFYVIGNTGGSMSSANVMHLGPAAIAGGGSVSATSAGGASRSGTSGTTLALPLASPRVVPRTTSGSTSASGAVSLPGAHQAVGSSQLSLGTAHASAHASVMMLPAGGSSGAGPPSSSTPPHGHGQCAGPSTGGAGGPPHRLSPASSTSTFGLSTLVGQPSVAGQVSTHSAVSGNGAAPKQTGSTTGQLGTVSGSQQQHGGWAVVSGARSAYSLTELEHCNSRCLMFLPVALIDRGSIACYLE